MPIVMLWRCLCKGGGRLSEILHRRGKIAFDFELASNQLEHLPVKGWSDDMAFPILYKFTHRESFVRFDMMVSGSQRSLLCRRAAWLFAPRSLRCSLGSSGTLRMVVRRLHQASHCGRVMFRWVSLTQGCLSCQVGATAPWSQDV